MPANNPYYIPKENLPKTEQVIYLDQNYQPMSYEDFMKTYQSNEALEILNEAEWQDRVLHGPQYGPGAEQSNQVAKVIIKTAVTIGTGAAIAATGPFAIPLGVTTAAFAHEMGKTARERGDDGIAEIADSLFSAGTGSAIGGAVSGTLGAASSSVGHRAAYEIASHGGVITNGAKVLINTGKVISIGQRLYEIFEDVKERHDDVRLAFEIAVHSYHGEHKDKGKSYDSDCPVCRGDF